MDCVIKITAVVAMYAGSTEMLHKVEDVIRLTNNCDIAVTTGLAAARFASLFSSQSFEEKKNIAEFTSELQHWPS